jgi:hypothetical protein
MRMGVWRNCDAFSYRGFLFFLPRNDCYSVTPCTECSFNTRSSCIHTREEREPNFRIPLLSSGKRWRNSAAEFDHLIASASQKAQHGIQQRLAGRRTRMKGRASRDFGSLSSLIHTRNARKSLCILKKAHESTS